MMTISPCGHSQDLPLKERVFYGHQCHASIEACAPSSAKADASRTAVTRKLIN